MDKVGYQGKTSTGKGVKKILDPCCGSRMFWFEQYNRLAILYAFAIEVYADTGDYDVVWELKCYHGICWANCKISGYYSMPEDDVGRYMWPTPSYYNTKSINLTALRVRYEYIEKKIQEIKNKEI